MGSENVELRLSLDDGSGERVLEPVLAGEAAESRPGEGAAFLNSGETVLSTSSGEAAVEATGEGGVYRGAGEETALSGSSDSLVSWLSGVAAVSLPAVERSEISSGVSVQSVISGVEPLLKRSGKETLPLSSEKGEDA